MSLITLVIGHKNPKSSIPDEALQADCLGVSVSAGCVVRWHSDLAFRLDQLNQLREVAADCKAKTICVFCSDGLVLWRGTVAELFLGGT